MANFEATRISPDVRGPAPKAPPDGPSLGRTPEAPSRSHRAPSARGPSALALVTPRSPCASLCGSPRVACETANGSPVLANRRQAMSAEQFLAVCRRLDPPDLSRAEVLRIFKRAEASAADARSSTGLHGFLTREASAAAWAGACARALRIRQGWALGGRGRIDSPRRSIARAQERTRQAIA